MSIEQNLSEIKPYIQNVTLICATKYVGVPELKELLRLGETHFGENRVDSFLEKVEALKEEPVDWHFIGHLQTNKVKKVINHINCLHSLDREALAESIQKYRNQVLDCFVEVNISSEPSKTGLKKEETINFIKNLAKYDKIRVIGLMGMAENTEDETILKKQFTSLKILRDEVRNLALPYAPCKYLSMGMSHDYKIAIECGASHIRLGSILFRNEGIK